MSAIFLSASVPLAGRGDYYRTADPFLIQLAVREFVTAALGRRRIVWGGHPAITPMVLAVCEDLGVEYTDAVVLYQSRFFKNLLPPENQRFANVVYVDAVDDDLAASLAAMRESMLSRADLSAAVFIGGMEGILDEYALFTRFHPEARVLAVSGPGGAALELAQKIGVVDDTTLKDVDFVSLFHSGLGIRPDERRSRLGPG